MAFAGKKEVESFSIVDEMTDGHGVIEVFSRRQPGFDDLTQGRPCTPFAETVKAGLKIRRHVWDNVLQQVCSQAGVVAFLERFPDHVVAKLSFRILFHFQQQIGEFLLGRRQRIVERLGGGLSLRLRFTLFLRFSEEPAQHAQPRFLCPLPFLNAGFFEISQRYEAVSGNVSLPLALVIGSLLLAPLSLQRPAGLSHGAAGMAALPPAFNGASKVSSPADAFLARNKKRFSFPSSSSLRPLNGVLRVPAGA